jgi:radical SAM superfamily enzyme YgiQ (UPF0313 family)
MAGQEGNCFLRVVLAQMLDRSEPDQIMFAPPGLGHLVSFASSRMDGLEFSYAEDAQEVLREEPDVVGITAVSENFDAACKLAADLRESFDGPMFLGGIHISTMPGNLPDEFDAGVIGEGEMVFLQLLRAIEVRGNCWKDSSGLADASSVPPQANLLHDSMIFHIPIRVFSEITGRRGIKTYSTF